MKRLDNLEFHSRIAKALVYRGEVVQERKHRGCPSESPLPIKRRAPYDASDERRFDGGGHFPNKTEQKYAQRCRSKTRYFCCLQCATVPSVLILPHHLIAAEATYIARW